MSVINTNYLALVSQNNLTKSQNALGTAIERLSSGLRINSAKDDAAGQAIANRFTANIKGLTQAARNANDGISIAQTTEGALNEINNNLQRIRELSVQAANGSNSDTDLESIQAEIQQRLGEINRVSEQTQFNGVHVLASDNTLTIQVGAHDSQTIDVNLKEITASTLGLSNLNVSSQITSTSLTAVTGNLTEAVAPTTLPLTFTGASNSLTSAYVADDGALYVTDGTNHYAASFDEDTNVISYDSSAPEGTAPTTSGATSFVNASGNLVELADVTAALTGNRTEDTASAGTFTLHQANADGTFKVSDGTNTYDATVDLSTGVVTIGTQDGTADPLTGYTEATGGVLNVPGTAAVAVDLGAVNTALGGTNALFQTESGDYLVRNTDSSGNTSYYEATVNATTGAVTAGEAVVVDPLASIDAALAQVDSLRSDLGAIQNRFQSTIANLNNTVNNLSAARSRIEDADYAVEVSNMTRAQILQQAGTSVLAQANQVPQTVLSLLR